MYVNKETKAKLEKLSAKVFGSKQAWNKILAKGRIAYKFTETYTPGVRWEQRHFTLDELISYMEKEAQKIDDALIRKI